MSTEFAEAFVDSDENVCVVYGDDSDQPINPNVIREAGWIKEDEQVCEREHCDERAAGYCSCGPLAERVIEPLHRWHNENHSYSFDFCDESPCREIREYMRAV